MARRSKQGLKMSNWPEWLPLKKELKSLTPYGAPQVHAEARLNTNENPYGPTAELSSAIAKRIGEVAKNLNRYPDRDAIKLRAELAKYLNRDGRQAKVDLTVSNIWAANGSNEILQSIFLAFGSGAALGFLPSYSMHPLIARVAGVNWISGNRNLDFSLDTQSAIDKIKEIKPSLTFVTTPNNPTGQAVKYDELKSIAEATASIKGLLIVDEAYAEFSRERSAIHLIKDHPNVIVSRTMSKAFAFAGARLGYLAADQTVIDAIQLVRLPYHLSALTQAAAEVALDFQSELLARVAQIVDARDEVSKALVDLGLKVVPSDANFILFSGFEMSSKQLWQQLLAEGVLIRDVELDGWLRVTIGNDAENQLFLKALKGSL
ncbi:MAG: hypothetical protein RL740_826 [Actinomycetota bacterium]